MTLKIHFNLDKICRLLFEQIFYIFIFRNEGKNVCRNESFEFCRLIKPSETQKQWISEKFNSNQSFVLRVRYTHSSNLWIEYLNNLIKKKKRNNIIIFKTKKQVYFVLQFSSENQDIFVVQKYFHEKFRKFK